MRHSCSPRAANVTVNSKASAYVPLKRGNTADNE